MFVPVELPSESFVGFEDVVEVELEVWVFVLLRRAVAYFFQFDPLRNGLVGSALLLVFDFLTYHPYLAASTQLSMHFFL